MKSIIHWWVRNHLAANFLMLAIVVGGVLAWGKLRKEIFPEITTDFILITLPYPNATPEAVEKGVVKPVEEAIADLEGIKRLTSTSNESSGVVVVEAQEDTDIDVLVTKLKSRIDGIQNMAKEAEEPKVEAIPIKSPILSITLTAPTDEKGQRWIAERVRDDLLALEEVSSVDLSGVKKHEISIEVSEATLRSVGISFEEVAAALRQSSLDLPAGSLHTKAGEILIRTASKQESAQGLENLTVLTRPDGSRLRLGDIAKVTDGFEEVASATRFDGKDALVINVNRTGNEDTLVVAAAVKERLPQLEKLLPEGTKLEVWNDLSLLLQGRMDLMTEDALQGFVLVCIVLALFLRPALAFFVALGIPIAFCGGALFMPWAGISINMISIFAFILVLGIVTDDAIVVGENVYERMRRGEPAKLAAPRGTYEVMVVAMFGVFTVICSFLPMLGITGVSGEIWKNIPWVVIPVLIISLIETNFILPAHLAHLKPEKPYEQVNRFVRMQRKITAGVDKFVAGPFRQCMGILLRHRYTTLASFIAAMVIAVGLIVGGVIKFEFFPHVEGETVAAKLTLPKGAPAEQTAAAVARIEAAARSLNETLRGTNGEPIIRHMLAHEGSQPFKVSFAPSTGGGLTENLGEVTLELLPAADRTISTETIVAEWRKRIGEIPGVEELSFIGNTSRTGNAFDLEFHSPDPKELRAAVDFFKEKLRSYASVADVSDNNRQGKRELLLGVTPQGETAQLTLGMISNQVRQAFYGEEVHRLQRGRDEVKVMLRYPREERLNLDNLERMQLRLPDGTEVPFHEAATAESARGPASIYRAEQQPAIRVTGDINKSVPGANANEVVKDLDEKIFPEMLQRFPSVSYAYQGEQKDQRQSMQELGFGFILALAGIFIILAIPLRSYVQPLIVMSVIPFGALGAVVGHVLFQVELSIMSMIGIVAVAGVVVNESLVLVEYVNRHRQKGLSVLPAAQEAACARFQAIMLTSVTSFIGILPLMLEKSLQAKFLIPCGISLAFGCLFNLVNTLVLVPNVYAILEDIKGMLFTPTKLAYMEEQEQQEAAERGVEWM